MLIPPSILSLHTCGDTEVSRYALGGIKIERVGDSTRPLAIATDGRKMVCVEWQEDDPAEFPIFKGNDWSRVNDYEVILSNRACKEAAKLSPKKSPKPILLNVAIDEKNTNGSVPMGGTDLEQWSVINPLGVEGRFPKWRDVIPKYKPEETQSILIDPYLMIDVLQAFIRTGCCDGEHREVVLTIKLDKQGEPDKDGNVEVDYGNNHAMLLTTHHPEGRNGCAVLMPLAVGGHKHSQTDKLEPVWIPSADTPAIKPVAEVPEHCEEIEDEDDDDEDEDFEDNDGEELDDDCDRPMREVPSGADLASSYNRKQLEKQDAKKQTDAMEEARKIVAEYETQLVKIAPDTCKCAGCHKMIRKVFLTERKHKLFCPDC